MWTIDKSAGGPLGGLENERNAFDQAGLQLPRQLLADTATAGVLWKDMIGTDTDTKVDLILFDAGHFYEEVWAELDAWFGHLRDTSIIVVHNYADPVWPQVKQAVDEWLGTGGYDVQVLADPEVEGHTLYAATLRRQPQQHEPEVPAEVVAPAKKTTRKQKSAPVEEPRETAPTDTKEA
jgi:hypothetical protein